MLLWAPLFVGCHQMPPTVLEKKSFSQHTYISSTYKYIYINNPSSAIVLTMPSNATNCISKEIILSCTQICWIHINTFTYILLSALLCGRCHQTPPTVLQKKSFSHICKYVEYIQINIHIYQLYFTRHYSLKRRHFLIHTYILNKYIHKIYILLWTRLFRRCLQTLSTALQKKKHSHMHSYALNI